MTRPIALALTALSIAACKPPDAPAELDELAVWLFRHLDAPQDAPLRDGLGRLDAWLDRNIEATEEGYTVSRLSTEDVARLPEGHGTLKGLTGAAVGVDLRYTPEDVAPLLTTISPEAIFESSYHFYHRDHLTDPVCFAAATCDQAAQRNHARARYAGGLVNIENRNLADLRWIHTEAGPAILHRTWLTEPAKVSLPGLQVPQQFYLNVVLPHPGGHRRLQATWIAAEIIGANVPEGIALSMVLGSMRSGATAIEDWYDAEE